MLIDTEIKEFGNSIGIKNLNLNKDGCLKFKFEQNKDIFIETAVNNFIYFFIIKTYDFGPLPYFLYKKALSLPMERKYKHFQIQAIAKSDNNIGFFTKMLENSCNQQTLYKVFKYLLECIEEIEK